MNQLEIIKTRVVDDYNYVDLCKINGQLVTYWLRKAAQPNIFQAIKAVNGDVFETISP
jgi:hypothetical protein